MPHCLVWFAAFTMSVVLGLTTPPVNVLSTANDASRGLLIAVITSPNHQTARKAIRSSWGSSAATALDSNWNVQVKFFIGNTPDTELQSQITTEQSTSGDLVRIDVEEKYENLGAKTLAAVSWASDNGFKNFLKVDDDTALNVRELLRFLDTQGSTDNIYSGVFKSDGEVMSDPNSKWFMSDQYHHDTYPKYAFGPCYFLGAKIVKYISDQRKSLPVFRVEDAGVGIWIESLNVVHVDMSAWLNLADCPSSSNPVFVSPVNAQELTVVLQNMKNGNVCGNNPNDPYVLEECRTRRCHCWPYPEEGCAVDFAKGEYVDVIPRL